MSILFRVNIGGINMRGKSEEYEKLMKSNQPIEVRVPKSEKKHKCRGCMWGSYAGNKYVCMFQRCVKGKEE
jgi:hypothetical protein